MTTLHAASAQWASRPSDERFLDLDQMLDQMMEWKRQSRQAVVSSRRLEFSAGAGNQLVVSGGKGVGYEPTHWSFGQLCNLVNAPAKYLRRVPAALAADMLTWGYKFERDSTDTGVLIRTNEAGPGQFMAATGPNYGRIWNADVVSALRERFGNGLPSGGGDFTVPGEFGKEVEVTKANTTLYASDRDMFVFLADEKNRITLPNRRGGKGGTLARGFFCWNSEVGDKTMGVDSFLFDYVCCNRIVWGAEMVKSVKLRHTASAPDKFVEQIMPMVAALSHGSARPWEEGLKAAQEAKVVDLDAWLAKRNFSETLISQAHAVHQLEEGRPMETVWDSVVGLTAVARGYKHQDSRVALERAAGELLDSFGRPVRRTLAEMDL